MSDVSIKMTGIDSAQIRFHAMRRGTYLTAGPNEEHQINISDGQFLRRITGEFFRLRNANYTGLVALKLGDAPRIRLDATLWRDLGDALLAFTWNIDLSKHLVTA